MVSEILQRLAILFVTAVLTLSLVGAVAFGGGYLFRNYDVWAKEMKGKAALMEASQTRQILVEQAKAELESAELRAKAISIVGQAAQQYPEYRQQEFIGAFGEALKEGNISQIIYVPTESNIPILEANRLK